MSRFPPPPPGPAPGPAADGGPQAPEAPPEGTVVAKGMTWKGELVAAEDVRIAGYLEGNIESTGIVTVERSGLVRGRISAARVVVAGEVEGDVRAARLVRVEAGGRVLGDLEARSVSVVDGALVGGAIRTLEEGEAATAGEAGR